ncbi:MAG: mandelate racemase/muconate lactonizing enzyme family protein [Alphaproteobacteria bacterium]|nr:mandelate racemase/muconate lactonizing enzyme family protein [Alphaproteobacteria bacterium]
MTSTAKADLRITDVIAHPLRAKLPQAQVTSQGDWPALDICVVEVRTDAGITGWGECLARSSSVAYAAIVERLLKPAVLGRDPLDAAALWRAMRRPLTGRTGGMQIEAIAGVDIALWDIAGKVAGLPLAKLLGGIGRTRVLAYASSINWGDDARAEAETRTAVARGFRSIKVKIGGPPAAAIRRAELIRKVAGDDLELSVDANWAFNVDEATLVGEALAALRYSWFEEPIAAEDIDGYARLRARTRVRLAAGESDFTVADARDLIATRSVGVIQPDVARSGGVSETRRIADLADAFHVAYCPHVGWSGAICAAASLQLAAYAPNFHAFECMVFDNPLREALLVSRAGSFQDLREGLSDVPQGPGLGVEIDRDALARYRAS